MTFIPKTLEHALREGTVVPFVGAGVSMAVRNKSNQPLFPSWIKLLQGAAERLEEDGNKHEANVVIGLLHKRNPDYLGAALHARDGLGPLWYSYLKSQFDPPEAFIDKASLTLARSIWTLPSKLVITTNYDQVLRFALPNPNDMVQINVDASPEITDMLRGRIERPTVWHLHGHIHDAQRIVLTPDGYTSLYPTHEGDVPYQAALHALRQLLTARTLLFVGFSLEDQHFGDQIEWVNRAFVGAAGPHYLLVPQKDLQATQRRLAKTIVIQLLPFDDFGDPLVARIEELAAIGRGDQPATVPASTADVAPTPEPVAAPVSPSPTIAVSTPSPDEMLDVRRSYRRVYAYQRCIFDRLADLSDALGGLGLTFERWDPAEYARPPRSTTEFFRRSYWAWDLLPAYNLSMSWQGGSTRKGGTTRVELKVVADTGFKSVSQGEPDPKYFEPADSSRSSWEVSLLHITDTKISPDQAWKSLNAEGDRIYDGGRHKIAAGNGECHYQCLKVDLNAVLTKEGLTSVIIEPIQAFFRET